MSEPTDRRSVLTNLHSARSHLTVTDRVNTHSIEWRELADQSWKISNELRQRGLGEGSLIGILGGNSLASVLAIVAVWMCGGAVTVCPTPARGQARDDYWKSLAQRLSAVGVAHILIDDQYAGVLPGKLPILPSSVGGAGPLHVLELAAKSQAGAGGPNSIDDLAIVQFTSGTTSAARGVPITFGQLVTSLDAMALAAMIDPETDVLLSWLPLSHDMGLIGFLAQAIRTGCRLTLAPTECFGRKPIDWLRWIESFQATISGGPNFAYAMATRAARARHGNIDLSTWRLAFNGAESIDPEVVEQFNAVTAEMGFSGAGHFCVYGLAEATLGVTFPPATRGLEVDSISASSLRQHGVAERESIARLALRLPKLGSPIGETKVRVRSENPKVQVGPVDVRGPAVIQQYIGSELLGAGPFLEDGWLSTGDLGYWADGELVITGRSTDTIIVGGLNILPEEVERAAAGVEGVRPGNVAAIGVRGDGTEELVIVAESHRPSLTIAREVRWRVRNIVGITPGTVEVVLAGTLPKTSSGKLQRSEVRRMYENGLLP